MFVFTLDDVKKVRRVECADEVEAVCGVSRNLYDAIGLWACLFVAADHIEVDYGACSSKRTQRMLRHIVGAQKAALFGGKDYEEDGALRLCRIRREGMRKFNDTDGAGAVVVSAVPDVEMMLAVLLF